MASETNDDDNELYKSASDADEDDDEQTTLGKRPHYVPVPPPQDDSSNPYGRSHFGNFGEYMRRKRAKLQIQNQALAANNSQSSIFSGISIYINGWTQPSLQDLRTMIVQNGGIYQPYLDKKSLVTHVVATTLTPAKVKEYQNLKVALPDWIVQSVEKGKLLPWHQFRYRHPTENAQSLLQHSFGPDSTSSGASTSKKQDDATPPLKEALIKTSTPRYTPHASNVNAQRAMNKEGWREANTSASSGFVEGYYKHSRLHHLSTWKAELKELVRDAQERAEQASQTTAQPLSYEAGKISTSMKDAALPLPSKSKGKGKEKERDPTERVIMHCDFDSFFVAVGLMQRPELRGKPVVVCHSQGTQGGASSTSEVASCSYEARARGIKNGMSLYQARKLCPDVATIPYEFERYKEISLEFYTVLMKYADELQAVSVDEALVNVASSVRSLAEDGKHDDAAKAFAEQLRAELKAATQCEVSIGIGANILLARLATRRAKPAGSYHLVAADMGTFIEPLEITNLHGIGWSIKQKCLDRLGSCKLVDLKSKSRGILSEALGPKTGAFVYNAIRGVDDRKLDSHKERQSLSVEINYGIRFRSKEETKKFVQDLSVEVAKRLKDAKMTGTRITLKLMKRHPDAPQEPPKFMGHGKCETFHQSAPLAGKDGKPTRDAEDVGTVVWKLIESFQFDVKELRGVGVTIRPGAAEELGQSRLTFTRQSTAENNTPRIRNTLGLDTEDAPEEEEHGSALFPTKKAPDQQRMAKIVQALAPRSRSGLTPKKLDLFSRKYIDLTPSDEEDSAPPAALAQSMDGRDQSETRSLNEPGELNNGLGRETPDAHYIERIPLVLQDAVEPPIATFRRPPGLKGPDGQRVEDSDQIQQLVTQWVEEHETRPPEAKDSQVFKKFLVQCVDPSRSTDLAIETATEVMRWWKYLLTRQWPVVQNEAMMDQVGKVWWETFEDVQASMNLYIEARFGGGLCI